MPAGTLMRTLYDRLDLGDMHEVVSFKLGGESEKVRFVFGGSRFVRSVKLDVNLSLSSAAHGHFLSCPGLYQIWNNNPA